MRDWLTQKELSLSYRRIKDAKDDQNIIINYIESNGNNVRVEKSNQKWWNNNKIRVEQDNN